jgi:hypothetical protein
MQQPEQGHPWKQGSASNLIPVVPVPSMLQRQGLLLIRYHQLYLSAS